MVTKLDDIKATVNRASNSIAIPWLQGEQDTFTLQFVDDSSDPIDLTNRTITCTTRYYTGSVEEELATVAGSEEEVLVASISDLEVDASRSDGTLTVTKANDPTTGFASVLIPQDIYTDEVAPSLDSGVPIVVLYFKVADSSDTNARIFKFRQQIYIRDGGPT